MQSPRAESISAFTRIELLVTVAWWCCLRVLADSLERTVRQPDLRQLLLDGQLVLLTPYAPTAGFSVGAAMGRNKVIYGLADFAVVVSSDYQTGGAWAGAVEALKAGWCPLIARNGANVPKGNRELFKLGAAPMDEDDSQTAGNLADWLRDHVNTKSVQRDLFEQACLSAPHVGDSVAVLKMRAPIR